MRSGSRKSGWIFHSWDKTALCSQMFWTYCLTPHQTDRRHLDNIIVPRMSTLLFDPHQPHFLFLIKGEWGLKPARNRLTCSWITLISVYKPYSVCYFKQSGLMKCFMLPPKACSVILRHSDSRRLLMSGSVTGKWRSVHKQKMNLTHQCQWLNYVYIKQTMRIKCTEDDYSRFSNQKTNYF